MSEGYQKFLPEGIPSWQMPYWQSLREHAVRIQRCDPCGTYRYVPKEICPSCHSSQARWAPITGTGELYTYTVVRRAPTPAYQAEAPYVIVHAAMDEGFRMIGSLRGADPGSISIGDRLRVAYEDATAAWTLLQFERI